MPGAIVLPSWVVDAVCLAPAARTPRTRTATTTATTPSTSTWDAISRDRDTFTAWMERHVVETTDVHEYHDVRAVAV